MVTMHILRMLADLSFFYALAGLVASRCGGSGAILGMLLQCVCFGLSFLGSNKRWLRLILLLPITLGWALYRASAADCILMLPPAIYIIWLVFKGDYVLEQGRQRRLFTAFCRAIVPFALLTSAGGFGADLRSVTLPLSAVMLTASILLMRSLRHDAEIYRKASYQLVNLSAVALATGAAIALSTKRAMAAYGAFLKAFYRTLLLPVLTLLLKGLLYIMHGIAKLLEWLGLTSPELNDVILDDGGIDEMLEQINAAAPESANADGLRYVLIALGILAVISALVLFFRWLNRRSGEDAARIPVGTVRIAISGEAPQEAPKDSSPVRSVRHQYRKFLKLCAARGAGPKKDSTSLDMEGKARRALGRSIPAGDIRDIYILARYDGTANQDSVRRMKKLYAETKKIKESGDL